MERYDILFMQRASQDLDEIYAYIAKSILEPKTAIDLVGKIEDEILSLDIMLHRCSERKIGIYANQGYRQLFVENYTVVFRINEVAKQVIIVTIRYTPSQF